MRTLYRGGVVHSPADPAATAFVDDDGTVGWLGPDEGAASLADAVDAVVELDGALVTPAFVDAHVHVTEAGLALDGVDLVSARSIGEVLAWVEEAVRRGRGRPVLGHGWDEQLLAERRPPTRQELDRASAGGVVYLSRVDGHSAVVSSALAAAAELRGQVGWSEDGRVERDAHHVVRNATRTALSRAMRMDLQRKALRTAAACGIAAVHEASAPHIAPREDLTALMALVKGAEGRLPLVVAYRGELVGSPDEARDVVAWFAERGTALAGLAGDLNVDGSVGSRTAAYRDPYTDAPGTRGHAYLSAEDVRDHVVACTTAGLQAGFHVIGDAGADTVLTGFRLAADVVGLAALRGGRHRLEHIESVDAAGVAALTDLGLVASVQPAFDALWGGAGGMYAARLGVERALMMNPFGTLATAGVPLALGSDCPVTPFDPWGAVRACAWHHVDAQRLAVATAFAAHTRGGWRAAGYDDRGVLRPGADATYAIWRLPNGEPWPDGEPWPTGEPWPDGDPWPSGTHLPGVTPSTPTPECLRTTLSGHPLFDALT